MRTLPERKSPTHSVVSRTTVAVAFELPENPPPPGHDAITIYANGGGATMTRQDWQQFVQCVNKADDDLRAILDIPGRPLPPTP